jgi:hypothetical protein
VLVLLVLTSSSIACRTGALAAGLSGRERQLSSPIELSFVSIERLGFNPHGSPSSGIQSEVDQ